MTVVQQPGDATFDAMPLSALDQLQIGYSLPAAEIGSLVTRLCEGPLPIDAVKVDMQGKQLEVEVAIAAGGNALRRGVMTLGEPLSFSCPECHGVLIKLTEGKRSRFRCHTGHPYKPSSLLSGAMTSIGEGSWQVMRALEEAAMLLEQMGRDIADGDRPKTAELFFERAREAACYRGRVADFLERGVSMEGALRNANDAGRWVPAKRCHEVATPFAEGQLRETFALHHTQKKEAKMSIPKLVTILASASALSYLPCAVAQTGQITQAASTTMANALPAPDKDFVQNATMANSTEIDASNIALSRSADKDVKSFARTMVMDHTRLTVLLKMAAPHGVSVPQDNSDTTLLDSLKAAPSAQFDRLYIQKVALQGHKDTIAAFKTEIASGQNNDLKTAASKALPTIEEHYQMGMELAKKKGVVAQ